MRIGFVGPFADVNFGDYGMLVNNILDLGSRHEYVVFTYDEDFLQTLVEDYFSGYKVQRRYVDPDWFDGTGSLQERALTPFEILKNPRLREYLREVVQDLDVLVVNGGGYFNALWARPHRQSRLLSIMAVALVADQLGKRVVFTANGFGPFGEFADFFANFFNSLSTSVFYCRETLYSAAALRALGVDQSRIRNAPDDLLVLNSSLAENSLALVPTANRYVVIETYLPIEYLRTHVDQFRSFVKQMKELHNLDTVFMPLNVGAGGVDQGQFLAERVPDLIVLDISDRGYLPLEDARSVIDQAELVISSRYHALVFAVALGTPVLSVMRDVVGNLGYYYNKNSGLLRMALDETACDEHLFLYEGFATAMDVAVREFPELVSAQQKLFKLGSDQNANRIKDARAALIDTICTAGSEEN